VTPPDAASPVPARFHLAVDDGGEFFAVCGRRIVLGHVRSARADLPLLADVEDEHGCLEFDLSFHAGPRWRFTALARPDGDARPLVDGAIIELSPRVGMRFRRPEASSASARLELLGGVECLGARTILLLAPGRGGRLRIGSRQDRLVPVPEVVHEATLEEEAGELRVACAGGVRICGVSAGGPGPSLRIPLPPTRALALALGARAEGRAPLGILLAPARMEPPPRPEARGA